MNPSNPRNRTVACVSCHKSKVKCIQEDPDKPCLRCQKSGKECIIDPKQLKKRQKLNATIPQYEEQIKKLMEELRQKDEVISSLSYSKNRTALHLPSETGDIQDKSSIPSPPDLNKTNAGKTLISSIINTPSPDEEVSNTLEKSGNAVNLSAASSVTSAVRDDSQIKPNNTTATANMQSGQSIKQANNHFLPNFYQQQQAHASYILNCQTQQNLISELRSINSINLQKYYNVSSTFSSIGKQREAILRVDYLAETDVIGKGLLTAEEVRSRLNLYMTHMYSRFSVVSIFDESNNDNNSTSQLTVDENFDIEEFRRKSPFLFIVILAISSIIIPSTQVHVNLQLVIKATEILSHEVLIVGSKSIELLQSMLLMCIWYDSGELFQHRRYHLVNSLCVSMAQDLGLSGKLTYYFSKIENIVKRAPLSDVSQSLHSRKLALTVYVTNLSFCMFLKRESASKWTSYLEECYEILVHTEEQKHNNYKKLAIFAKMHSCFEKVYQTLHRSEFDPFNVNDARSRYIITDLYNSLLQVKRQIPEDDHCFLMYYYSIEAYLFEPSLHRVLLSDNNVGKTAKPNSADKDKDDSADSKNNNQIQFSTHMIAAIGNCANSCIKGIMCYKKLTYEQVASLPLIAQTRIFYICGMLIRLRYLSLMGPKFSELAILPDTLLTNIHDFLEINYNVSKSYPYNYFLPKSRLVLILALQTYSTQVKETLQNKYNITSDNINDFDNQKPYDPEINDELIANSQMNPSDIRPLTHAALWSPHNRRIVNHYQQPPQKPAAEHAGAENLPNPFEFNRSSSASYNTNAAFPILGSNSNLPRQSLRDIYNDPVFNTNPASATMRIVDSNATNSPQTGTPVGGIVSTANPDAHAPVINGRFEGSSADGVVRSPVERENMGTASATNNINLIDFLFDNSGTANNVGINQPTGTNNGLASTAAGKNNGDNKGMFAAAASVNGNPSNVPLKPSMDMLSTTSDALANCNLEGKPESYSYWTLNDNIWNDLLMGVDFGSNGALGNNFYANSFGNFGTINDNNTSNDSSNNNNGNATGI
ncbi:War1 protein [Saccharomycopsis crataegensis]|uniref:War1 protein n=1 Tax=Saccharomycopsis crataegensis TaxID=43959 RepID=A0AAV5QE51_9ASCO|nr:War1 protein [Saccharomycopsis crataegensis]